MTVKRNTKMPAGIRIFLRGGLVTLAMLLIAFSISCQASVTEPAPTPEPEPAPAPESEPNPTTTPTIVRIVGFAFVPATITVPVGTTVTWTSNQILPHTVVSRDGLFDSGNLFNDDTFSYTFTQNGTFEYYCKIHRDMPGRIIVGE